MANFTLLTINSRGETILTRYNAVTGETNGLTFDESLNLSIDGNTLSFSMLKYHYEGSQKVVNVAATTLIYGSQIKVITNGQAFLFNVQSINYTFMQDNLKLDFSCVDAFQFETSKLGLGYTISEHTSDPDFLGAQPIDAWARKIARECALRWQYVPIDQANDALIRQFNNINVIQTRDSYDSSDEEAWAEQIQDYSVSPRPTNASFNTPVSFSCSNSNAFAALKQLATNNELILCYDYSTLNFWFVPQKNPWFKGYYFNPNNNLQAFTIGGDAQNLVTVLNVQGPNDYNNQEILLVPELPNNVLSYINSSEWSNSVYYANLYLDNCADSSDEDDAFYLNSAYIPWLENKLINIDYFKDSGIITRGEYDNIQNILNNDLRIVNGKLILQTSNYLHQYEQDYMKVNQKRIDLERYNGNLWSDISSIYSDIENASGLALIPIFYPRLEGFETTQKVVGLYIPEQTTSNVLQCRLNNGDWKNVDGLTSEDKESQYIFRDPGAGAPVVAEEKTSELSLGQLTIKQKWSVSEGYSISVEPDETSSHPDIETAQRLGTGALYYAAFPQANKFFSFIVQVFNSAPDGVPPYAPTATFTWNGSQFTPASASGYTTSGSTIYYTGNTFYYTVSNFVLNSALSLKVNNLTQDYSVSINWNNVVLAGLERRSEGKPLYVQSYGALSLGVDKSQSSSFYIEQLKYQSSGYKPSKRESGYVDSYIQKNPVDNDLVTVEPPSSDSTLTQIQLFEFQTAGSLHFYTINTPHIGVDDIFSVRFQLSNNVMNFTSTPQAYDSLYNAWLVGDSIDLSGVSPHSRSSAETIAGLDERLTEIGATYQANLNLYAEYAYKFAEYWNKPVGEDYTVGLVYSELRRVGLLADTSVTTIGIGDPFSASDNTSFTGRDKSLFEEYHFGGEQQTILQREDIIADCATIGAKLTEYWSIMYSAALSLGIFCPENWDCLSALEEGIESSILQAQLPLKANDAFVDGHWTLPPTLNTSVVPEASVETARSVDYRYYNENREPVSPINKLPTNFVGYTNTENYYVPWDEESLSPSTHYAEYWGIINEQHRALIDTSVGYETLLKLRQPRYYITDPSSIKTLAQIMREWLGPAKMPDINYDAISFTNVHYNPSNSFLAWLAQCREYDDALYYSLQKSRNDIWQHLYTTYPGVFRESTYKNEDAATSLQLYNAAKAQLNVLSQPQFTYSLTGMDIYMHDADYNPTTLSLGDQIRIDYQEDVHQYDTLNKALSTPLYITAIRHSLRNDGDYQFEVSTTRGTDVMMQRFAQLLSFGEQIGYCYTKMRFKYDYCRW